VPVALAGDEPWLLAAELPGVAVAVAPRRADAGRLLLDAGGTDPALFLLDDGFSHLRLARDLDLLVLPAADPLGGGRLAPGGRLREPLAAAARAHGLLLTGEQASAEAARAVAVALAPHGFAGVAFACPTSGGSPRLIAGDAPPPGSPLLLVTGVARPERVRRTAEALGITVADHLAFADHHAYPPRTLRRIAERRRRAGAAGVLTTAKDRAKLLGRLPGPLLELPLLVRPEPALWEWLDARLMAAGLAAGAAAR
jgi:tetraacyldisaccharide 4'-kinase